MNAKGNVVNILIYLNNVIFVKSLLKKNLMVGCNNRRSGYDDGG